MVRTNCPLFEECEQSGDEIRHSSVFMLLTRVGKSSYFVRAPVAFHANDAAAAIAARLFVYQVCLFYLCFMKICSSSTWALTGSIRLLNFVNTLHSPLPAASGTRPGDRFVNCCRQERRKMLTFVPNRQELSTDSGRKLRTEMLCERF